MHIQPAHQLAVNYGVKAIVYGPPGQGKTPLMNTAPAPLLCVSEPGMLSMRGSTIPATAAFDAQAIRDFYKWLWSSKEVDKYQTICVDSISQQAEIILEDMLKKHKDGRKAYGEMSREMMGYINGLYFAQRKNVVLIAKQGVFTENEVPVRKPYFPGQDLNVKIPHLFDEILHLSTVNLPGVGATKALRCHNSYDIMARDRTGLLAEYEPNDLSYIFNKLLKGTTNAN